MRSGLFVLISLAVLAGPAWSANPVVDSRKIAANLAVLEEIFVDQENSCCSMPFQVRSSDPLKMVKEWVWWREKENPGAYQEYQFIENYVKPEFPGDVQLAGTMSNDAACKAVMWEFEHWIKEYQYEGNSQDPRYLAARKRVGNALHGLLQAGAVLGFSGWEQNFSAAPTAYLLVIDPKAKLVTGLQLNPMNESY